MPRFLHVGCGQARKAATTPYFASAEWEELRLDIAPEVQPDIVASMTDMGAVPSGSMDALFASNTLEHLYLHEVPQALAEFRRVLAGHGHAVISTPDLQQVARLVAEGEVLEQVYLSPAGPISAHDMLYGHGRSIAAGALPMAHRCGFTPSSITRMLQQAGFVAVGVRAHPPYQLTAIACPAGATAEAMRVLLDRHRPRPG